MAQYMIELPDETVEAAVAAVLHPFGASLHWVAACSDSVYDNEWGFTDENAWEHVSESAQEIINEASGDDGAKAEWPSLPFNDWSVGQKRALIQMSVTRWGFLGPNGIEPYDLIRDYREGLLDVFNSMVRESLRLQDEYTEQKM